MMKIIQITLPPALLKKLDQAAEGLHSTRSGFIRRAAEEYLRTLQREEMERRCLEGLRKKPIQKEEAFHDDPRWNFSDSW